MWSHGHESIVKCCLVGKGERLIIGHNEHFNLMESMLRREVSDVSGSDFRELELCLSWWLFGQQVLSQNRGWYTSVMFFDPTLCTLF